MKKLSIMPFLIGMIFICIGCATHKPLTREESLALRKKQIEATQKVYHGVTKDEVLIAVDKLLRLADHDYKIQHTEDGLIAHRTWLLYFIFSAMTGNDWWYVKTKDVPPDGIKVIVRVVSSSSPIVAAPTTGGGGSYYATSLPPVENIVKGEALYKIFFKRLDYLLGKTEKWLNCKEARKWVKENGYKGLYEPLCLAFTVDDKSPNKSNKIRLNSQ